MKDINTEIVTDKYNTYNRDGYAVVDNFLPEEIANELHDIYEEQQKWEVIDQVRDGHYGHVFKTPSVYLPGEDEAYMARFERSTVLEQSARVQEIYAQYFVPALKKASQENLTEFDIRCYQLNAGDFYRTHIDDYAGSIGCVYYLNKKWIWDWGGLLHVTETAEAEEVKAIFPKFNRAVLLDHKKFRLPHFISQVAHFAKVPRYSIVSFNK